MNEFSEICSLIGGTKPIETVAFSLGLSIFAGLEKPTTQPSGAKELDQSSVRTELPVLTI